MIFPIFGTHAEFEHNLIRERTKAGLEAARKRGKLGGRPKVLNEEKTQFAKSFYDSKDYSINQIGNLLGVSKSTIYNYLRD